MISLPAKTVTGRVIDAQRVSTSTYGNPTYMVTLAISAIDGVPAESSEPVNIRTMDDAGLAYGITNPEYREVEHVFTLTRAGRIRSARKA